MSVDRIWDVMGYYGVHRVPVRDYWQAMPTSIQLLGNELEAPDLGRGANIASLEDLTDGWRVPVVAVAAVRRMPWRIQS